MKWLAALVILLLPAVVSAQATITVNSCDQTTVANRINQSDVAHGDIIVMNASGPCDYTTTFTPSKVVSLHGTGSTVIRQADDSSNPQPIIHLDNSSIQYAGDIDITGFLFSRTCSTCTQLSDGWLKISGYSGWNHIRVHHNTFTAQSRDVAMSLRDSSMGALIDNNNFTTTGFDGAGFLAVKVFGRGDYDWTASFTYGSTSYGFSFIEDNTMSVPADCQTYALNDLHTGGRVVIRYNQVTNAFIQTHSQALSGLPSGQAYEIYGNTVTSSPAALTRCGRLDKAIRLIGGTGVVFNNAINGSWAGTIALYDEASTAGGYIGYRANSSPFPPCNVGSGCGYCTGSATLLDQNASGGRLCRYQIGSHGVIAVSAFGGYALTPVQMPLYIWGNTCNLESDNVYSFGCISSISYGLVFGGSALAEARDAYNAGAIQSSASVPYDGTATAYEAVGWGTIARRPSTCTANTAYWATDEGEWNSRNGATPDGKMYICTSTNTWTAGYGSLGSQNASGLPVAYPHPLQTGGAPNTSPSLSISSPAANSTTTSTTAALTGTCNDDGGCTTVTGSNDLTGAFTITGTSNWSGTSNLNAGINVITVTGSDGTTTDMESVNVLREACGTSLPYTQNYSLNSTGTAFAMIPCHAHYGSGADFSIVGNKGQSNQAIRDFEVPSQLTLNTAQYAKVTIGTVTDAAGVEKQLGVGVNLTGNDGQDATKQGYFFQVSGTSSPYNIIGRYNGTNGLDCVLATVSGITVVANTTTMKLERDTSNTLHAYINDIEVASVSALGASCPNGSANFTGGLAGVVAYGSGTTWDNLEVGNFSPPPSDVTGPVVTITGPSSSGTFTVGYDTTTIATGDLDATATDAVGVTACTYENSTNPGTHAMTASPSYPSTSTAITSAESIPLTVGTNTITVRCVDAAQNQSNSAVLVVTRNQQQDPGGSSAPKSRRFRVIH